MVVQGWRHHLRGHTGDQCRAYRLRLPVGPADDDRIAGRDRAAVLEHRLNDRPACSTEAAETRSDMDRIGKIALGPIVDLDGCDHRPLVRWPPGQRQNLLIPEIVRASWWERGGEYV